MAASLCWSRQFVKFKFADAGRKTHQFKAKSIPRTLPFPPARRLFDFSSLSTFSYLFFHFFPRYNYVSGSKCNCKRVVCAWGGRVAMVGGGGGRGCNCYARTTKCNIKKLLSEREGKVLADAQWWRRRPYVFCESGGNYQSSSGEACQKEITPALGHTLGLPSPWRQAHIMMRARVCLPGH